MKSGLFLLLIVPTLASCGGGSGLPSDKQLSTLTDSEIEQLCRWRLEHIPTYEVEGLSWVACFDGPFDLNAALAQCVAEDAENLRFCGAVTVGQFEDCVAAIDQHLKAANDGHLSGEEYWCDWPTPLACVPLDKAGCYY